MLTVTLQDDTLLVGERFSLVLQRTLRLPDDGRTYPLPPGLGSLPLHAVEAYADRVPAGWREAGGYFLPLYQREALWLLFTAADWKPNAVQVGVGEINAVTGDAWAVGLQADPQNYLVCPEQPWLDGINVGNGTIRQFVAAPLGAGETVGEQLTGPAAPGGIQLRVYEPKPGRFPDQPPPASDEALDSAIFTELPAGGELGIAAGGRMSQRIYPDPFGLEAWDQGNLGETLIHIVDTLLYRAITGQEPPPSPITAEEYTRFGLPWFALYDEARGTVPTSERMRGVKSLGELDAERQGEASAPEQSVEIDPSQIIGVEPKRPTDP